MDFTDWRVWLKVAIPAVLLIAFALSRTPLPNPTQADIERIVQADTQHTRFPAGKVVKLECHQQRKGKAKCNFYLADSNGNESEDFYISLIYRDKQWQLSE
ncbi:hypothetical protein ACKLNO_02620 [Neisseriaceae bacterium B1]